MCTTPTLQHYEESAIHIYGNTIRLGASSVPLLLSSAFCDMTPLSMQTTKLGAVTIGTSLITEKIEISFAKSLCQSDTIIRNNPASALSLWKWA